MAKVQTDSHKWVTCTKAEAVEYIKYLRGKFADMNEKDREIRIAKRVRFDLGEDKMKLYEIAADYKNFLEAVENGDIPEEAISDTLESITSMLEEKADNIACMIKNMTAEAEAIKAEEQSLAERRKAKEKQIDRIKTYLSDTLINSGYTKLETARNKITFRKSNSVSIEDEAAFVEWAIKTHDEYLTYEDPTINKTAIKEALANGTEVFGVHIETKQNIQIK